MLFCVHLPAVSKLVLAEKVLYLLLKKHKSDKSSQQHTAYNTPLKKLTQKN